MFAGIIASFLDLVIMVKERSDAMKLSSFDQGVYRQ